MGAYLDRLRSQFDEITTGVDEILNRATEENREVTDEETAQIDRDNATAETLQRSIDHYAAMEETRARVTATYAKAPAAPAAPSGATTVARSGIQVIEPDDPDKELLREFPTVGEYIATVARALKGNKEDTERVLRATAHQTTADNPGIIPRPLVAPLISLVDNSRPFLQSIQNKRLTTGAFDRPIVTQHVAVGIQENEKDETESRKLIIGKLPVAAKTYAGHLNISRQDIKWTQPGVLQIVAEDFAHEYAKETDQDGVSQFLASLSAVDPSPVASFDAAGIVGALYGGAQKVLSSGRNLGIPDTFWVSPDVWGRIGSLVSPNGGLIFPSLTPGSTTGNTLGLRIVVDPYFPEGTGILGPSRVVEWYEDVDGLLQVQEPDVLGQLVGYAGYGAFLNTAPDVFSVLEIPAAATAPPATTTRTSSKSGS